MAMTIARGSFVHQGYIAIQFQQKLTETINEMLNKRITRFIKDLHLLISFNELADLVPLFIKLRNEVRACMFFNRLEFLDQKTKRDLEQEIKTQVEAFWYDTLVFLQRQTMAYANSDLEDSLYLIRRIKLFAEVG